MHLGALLGIKQVDEREQAAERVPEAGSGVEVAGSHTAFAKRAIVNHIAIGVDFMHAVREHQCAEEAAVERAQMVDVVAFHVDGAKHAVPLGFRQFFHLVERLGAYFFEVELGLFDADERRCSGDVHGFAAASLEAHSSTHVVSFHLSEPFHFVVSHPHTVVGKRLVELNHEVVGIFFADATTVAGVIAHNLVFLRNHLNPRTSVVGVNHDVGIVGFGESEAERSGTVGGSHLGSDVVIGKIHAIVVRLSHLGFVREPRGTTVLVYFEPASHRHD